jgi:hypothetical protein
MGGMNARAPRTDGRRAGAEVAAGKPMLGNAVPRRSGYRGFAPREHHRALTRGAGPMTNGLCPGSVAGGSCVEAVR